MPETTTQLPNILVVDDIPANIEAMQHILETMEVNVLTAMTGREALRIAAKHDLALVLMDVQMPEMDGYEAAALMHGVERTKYTPIIFVTANSRDEMHVLKGYDSGAVDYIMKPVNRGVLRSKVQIFLDLYNHQTELELLNLDLAKARDEAERSSAAKTEFLANISHELRTPMHAILGYARLGLKRTNVDEEKLYKYLSNIHNAGNRLLGLLNDLLDLAKMESGQMEYHFQENPVPEIIECALMELESLLEEKHIRVVPPENSALTASCDRERLIQVIINILSNAVKFSPEHSTITIVLHEVTHEGKPALQCSITDEGIGIPGHELEIIFDEFSQSEKTKTGAGGTGLGLPICRQIVHAHGGKIWADNCSEKGSVFTFIILCEPPTEAAHD